MRLIRDKQCMGSNRITNSERWYHNITHVLQFELNDSEGKTSQVSYSNTVLYELSYCINRASIPHYPRNRPGISRLSQSRKTTTELLTEAVCNTINSVRYMAWYERNSRRISVLVHADFNFECSNEWHIWSHPSFFPSVILFVITHAKCDDVSTSWTTFTFSLSVLRRIAQPNLIFIVAGTNRIERTVESLRLLPRNSVIDRH